MFKPPLFDTPAIAASLPLPGKTPGQASGQTSDQNPVMTLVHELATSLGRAIDAKDSHTLAHSEDVAEMSRLLALGMGLAPQAAHAIHVAGHLHDIGKIGVPDAVLGKPGRLTGAEWTHMRAHPAIGATILAPLTCLSHLGVVAMVAAHHERFDGSGYPSGLSGRTIPLGARIIAVADSLSAMLQSRPYRPAMTFEAADAEIVRCAGTQFDPEVVAAFVRVRDALRRFSRTTRQTGPHPIPAG